MPIQCCSSLVMSVGSPSESLPINVKEGFLFLAALFNQVLHWFSGPGHADFFFHVVGDAPSREMQLDSTSWQNGNHHVMCVGVSCHMVPRKHQMLASTFSCAGRGSCSHEVFLSWCPLMCNTAGHAVTGNKLRVAQISANTLQSEAWVDSGVLFHSAGAS